MVPADCDICKRHLMIWDVKTFYCRLEKGLGEIKVCNDCLARDRIKADETARLKFERIATPEEVAERDAKLKKIEADTAKKMHEVIFKDLPYDPGFHGPEPGSQDRFVKRKREVPWLRHTLWWLVHNCVSHPLIGFLPLTPFFKFHDWTSMRMHGKEG